MTHNNSAWWALLIGIVPIAMRAPDNACHAQPPFGATEREVVDPTSGRVIGTVFGGVTPGSETWGGYVIPDVDSKLSLASLLHNRTVAESLGVKVEGRKLIYDYLTKNGGSFRLKVLVPQGIIPPTSEELHAETLAHRAKSETFLDELISPEQWSRLRQVAYQVEVGRVGLAGALTRGRLGADSGVHGQQTDAIQRKAETAEAKAKAEIVRILTKMQDSVLTELTLEQQNAAKELLGEPFVFKEELKSSGGLAPGSEGEGGYEIPDVDNQLSLALLLNNRSIAQSLGLSADSIGRIRDYLVQNDKSFQTKPRPRSGYKPRTADEVQADNAAHHAKSAICLDEFVSPSQWAKLRQMAYQVEVSRIGLAHALTIGKLGASLGIEAPQSEVIQRKAEDAEARAKTEILQVLMQLQEEVLTALTPTQRKEAKELLGKPFVFKEELESSLRREPRTGLGETESKGD